MVSLQTHCRGTLHLSGRLGRRGARVRGVLGLAQLCKGGGLAQLQPRRPLHRELQ